MATFVPLGPFRLPIAKMPHGRRIDKDRMRTFFEESKCADDRGVYVFTLRTSRGAEYPYYVGHTLNDFASECFQPHKIEKYNDILARHRGTAWMYFLALESKYNEKAIKALEVTFIGLGMERNPRMRNVMHTRKDEIDVIDVMGAKRKKGARLKAARLLRATMGLA
ncbi:MAG TPA: hypothetical protein VGF98_10850 [Candidatus Tumulicola sp.]|jgi:hypothetical protein